MGENILLAMAFGINDSLSPYSLSVVLLFLNLIYFCGHARGPVILGGLLFIFSLSSTTFLSLLSGYDLWLESDEVNTVVRILSLGVGAVFVWRGLVIFMDWWRCKKNNHAADATGINRLPAFLEVCPAPAADNALPSPRRRSIRGTLILILIAVLLGTTGTVLCSLWAKSRYFYLTYYSLLTAGRSRASVLFLGIYCLAFAFSAVVAWVLVLSISYSEKAKRVLAKSVSLVLVASSAVSFSLGMGLIYLFFYR